MKKLLLLTFYAFLVLAGSAQQNTLLWRISGNGLQQPSYLFGTMHLLCAEDIDLSDSLRSAISRSSNVYLELQMDNMMEMMGAMQHMGMRGDTTLADLLSDAEYDKVRSYFEEHNTLLPFTLLETFKPLLAASLIAEQQAKTCDNMIAMEQLIMEEAKANDKKIKGLETMDYQLSIFDKIPYKLQAAELYKMITQPEKSDGNEIKKLTDAYRAQELNTLEELTKSEDMGIKNFSDLLLYDRNKNWAAQLKEIMPEGSFVFAVGAGHLPGEKGVINLLRKAGYTVEPVRNDMIVKKEKEI
ncbi:MAG: TraB/GumN family protein [Flavisolibacter sp.]